MRRLSWQQLLAFIAGAPDLEWLVGALRDKCALVPREKVRTNVPHLGLST